MFRKTSAIFLALLLTALPALFSTKTASALDVIPNPHQYRFTSIDLPESLDPGWAYDTASSELMMQVYEPLIAYDHESTAAFVPVLAKALPKIERVTETLTTTETVNKSNPVCTTWTIGTTNYHLFGWQDKNGSGDLTVGDVVWFENLADHEHSFHGVVKSTTGNVTLEVERVRVYFELRTDVKFHPWTSDIPGYEAHTADPLTTEDVEFTFERNCLLDHEVGPMPLIMMPTIGIMTTREYNLTFVENQTLVGHMIDNAFAHNNTHFWINLVQPFAPFLQIITQPWGSIMNKAWIIALQEKYVTDPTKRWTGWDSPPNYANWINYTNPLGSAEIDAAPGHMCGTGPYYFDFLTPDDRWQIKKFDGYWRGWSAEGRSEDLYLDTVTKLYYEDSTLAFPLFLSNDPATQCDSIYVPLVYTPDLLGKPGVRMWAGMPELVVTAFMMGYDPEETGIYLPQMPPGTPKHDFFGDIHIRRAFAHLVNHTVYIQRVDPYDGLVWPNSIIIDGLKYHNPDQELYQYDLSEALREFKLAFGGTEESPGPAYTQGFKVQLLYNEPGYIRQKYCEMLEYDLEVNLKALDPTTNFQAVVTGLPWRTVILPAMYAYQLAEWLVGWGADFPDAANFAKPYMHTHGDWSQFQRIQYGQSGMKQKAWDLSAWGLEAFGDPALNITNDYVDTVIDKVALIDDSTTAGYSMREALYYHLQEIYYQECPSYAIYQPAGRRWERDWVQGWYYNPINPYGEGPGGYFYHMWKGWCCHGDLDFKNDLVNGAPTQNYLTCDYLDLFKFRNYYTMPRWIQGHRMRYADYNNDNQVDYLDFGRFRNYYVYYPSWTLCPGPFCWHWPPPPY